MCSLTDHYTMVLLLFTCIFMIGLGMGSTSTTINWVKLQAEGPYVEDICPAEDIRFVKDSVAAAVTCGRICYEDEECKAVTYQVDDHKCTGCREFLKSLPTVNSAGVLIFSKRVLVCHDWTEEDDKAMGSSCSKAELICYHWTEEDIKAMGPSRTIETERKHCEGFLGHTYTQTFDECGECSCCQQVCYDLTEDDDKASRSPEDEKRYCEKNLGCMWTQGNDPKYPECGVCRCCKPKS